MEFCVAGDHTSPLLEGFVKGVSEALTKRGHRSCPQPSDDPKLVINVTRIGQPRPNFRRRSRATFVATVVEVDALPPHIDPTQHTKHLGELLQILYPVLVRALSNLVIGLVRTEKGYETFFVTLELGCYRIEPGSGSYFDLVCERLLPLALARFIIDNELVEDLPPALWKGNEQTEKMRFYGKLLDELGLQPAPFPIQNILNERDLRHVYKLYGITGLSYGNLSARHDEKSFWMTGRGVNKADLQKIGKDILLITGFDAKRERIRVSVPKGSDKKARASVDAIEHFLIYQAFPQVGAIMHVHAWIAAVPSTQQNYPCGTLELAQEVLSLVQRAPDPSSAVVGLKNHGLTITGHDLDELFARIKGKLIQNVPMG
ncbi:class II aldolase/adducin family protein [Candidatus Acetothermia bacterium]|nr:class II aldolase/adducin family protein [Candidatus Acetothermia bacterium]MCI2432236.1 class II aldolase/adducin family protein [Candidatus Acetothermia bacterium]MCI2436492.1 class II aldolase/adducin family protein [Candidatus Acetothermia bacterium]